MGQNTGKLITYTRPDDDPGNYHQNDDDDVWDAFHSANENDKHNYLSEECDKFGPKLVYSGNSVPSPNHQHCLPHIRTPTRNVLGGEKNFLWHLTVKEVPIKLGTSTPLDTAETEEQIELQQGLLQKDVTTPSRIQQNYGGKKTENSHPTSKRSSQSVTRNRSSSEVEVDNEKSVTEKSNLLQLSDANM